MSNATKQTEAAEKKLREATALIDALVTGRPDWPELLDTARAFVQKMKLFKWASG